MMITKTVYDEYKWYNNVPNNIANKQGYDIIEIIKEESWKLKNGICT